MTRYDVLIVGAGFAGCVLAERLATQSGKRILVVDRRPHIGGNAHDGYDDHGILVHHYGPHLFHTNDAAVFAYLSRFTSWRPYEHRVLAAHRGRLYPMPVNRTTINAFFGVDLATPGDVASFLDSRRERRSAILTSEDVIVDQLGRELFDAFFRVYTRKQWNREPRDLHAGVCGRIPVRHDDDDRYFTDRYQAIPAEGYTAMFHRMVAHPGIEVLTGVDFAGIETTVRFDRLIYTGPIDQFFGHAHGRLPYRSIRFEHERIDVERAQEAAQINHCDDSVPFTRVCEWKQITGQAHPHTVLTREYPTADGEPYYPVPSEDGMRMYRRYREEADRLQTVVFAGRLAEYRYYNMDQVVARALRLARSLA